MLIKQKSLKTRYIFSGLAICVVSLLLVSLTSYIVSYNVTSQQSNQRMQQTALKNSAELDSWFRQYGRTIEGMAEDIEMVGIGTRPTSPTLLGRKIGKYSQRSWIYT